MPLLCLIVVTLNPSSNRLLADLQCVMPVYHGVYCNRVLADIQCILFTRVLSSFMITVVYIVSVICIPVYMYSGSAFIWIADRGNIYLCQGRYVCPQLVFLPCEQL